MKSEEARALLLKLESEIKLQLEEFERVSDFKINSIEIGHYRTVSAIPERDDKPQISVFILARL